MEHIVNVAKRLEDDIEIRVDIEWESGSPPTLIDDGYPPAPTVNIDKDHLIYKALVSGVSAEELEERVIEKVFSEQIGADYE